MKLTNLSKNWTDLGVHREKMAKGLQYSKWQNGSWVGSIGEGKSENISFPEGQREKYGLQTKI
jgi:hypothetical protein